MKLAGHTMGTPSHSVEGAIDLFADLGFRGIEIIWDDDYRCAIPKAASGRELATLRKRIDDAGLETACLTPYMRNIASLDRTALRKDIGDFHRCMETAAALGGKTIRVYGGGYMEKEDAAHRDAMEGVLVDTLRELGEKASEFGIVLAVETHFNTLTCTAEETARLIRRTGHPQVQVLYDQPNLGFVGAEDHREAIGLLGDLIGMVHVKDFEFKDPGNTRFTAAFVTNIDLSERITWSRVPGEGVVPWPEILPMLDRLGYGGWLSFEYEYRWYPEDLPPPEEGMARGLRYIQGLLEQSGIPVE